MFSLTSSHQYYLYREGTDMRKSFDCLCAIVRERFARNPLSGEVFVFINKPRNKLKLLHWEQGGFVLYYKRLESGTFRLPDIDARSTHCQVTWPQLIMMIEGISIRDVQMRKRYAIKKSV